MEAEPSRPYPLIQFVTILCSLPAVFGEVHMHLVKKKNHLTHLIIDGAIY